MCLERLRTVLIVEDEAYIAMAIEDALEGTGYVCCGTAATEVEALRLCAAYMPDMAVLDINLGPGGSGLNVGRELSARGVAILYASGNCLGLEREMAEAGAHAYLTKPYALADLPRALQAVARLHRGQPLTGVAPVSFHLLS